MPIIDVVDGKEKAIMSIIWNLIQRYQLHQSDVKGFLYGELLVW